MKILWETNNSFSSISLRENPQYFTDCVTGSVYGHNEIEIKIDLEVCDFSVSGTSLVKLRQYCKSPSSTEPDSWVHIDSNIVGIGNLCVYCERSIERPESALLLSTAGANTGINLLCSDCCGTLYEQLCSVPEELIISRKI